MTLSRRNRKIMGPAMMIMLIAMSGGVARAADEESVCTFLLRQIGTSIQRASSAEDDAEMCIRDRFGIERHAVLGPRVGIGQ